MWGLLCESYRQSLLTTGEAGGGVPQAGIPCERVHTLHDLQRDGVRITPELVARLSPYLTEHIKALVNISLT
jgi:hypothetical protein